MVKGLMRMSVRKVPEQFRERKLSKGRKVRVEKARSLDKTDY